MITANVIHRVFFISNGNHSGSCCIIDLNNRQYLITARHLVSEITKSVELRIYHEKNWKNINLTLVGHCPNEIDISVFTANFQLTPKGLPCDPNPNGVIYGQDVYFLGFPYGIATSTDAFNRGFPLPFVKKAILSNIEFLPNKTHIFYLDGYNNPGFSGGPVVFSQQNSAKFKICGVIAGYQSSKEPVYKTDYSENLYYEENTGIIYSYSIEHAISIINENPIGFELPT